jgi:tetratricopeptide (TPR) repeat protein
MENLNQFELLASTALESENYVQAYDYFSKLLESDANNVSYWMGKAKAASHLNTLENPRVPEIIVCLKMAKIESFDKSEKNQLTNQLVDIIKKKIEEAIIQIDKEIEREFNSIPFPTGTLYEVQKLKKLPIMSSVGGKYRNNLLSYFELLEYVIELNPALEGYETIIEQFNKVINHSRQRNNYFGGVHDNEYNAKIYKIWTNAETNIKKINPDAIINTNTSTATSSGCFIATATTGDYNHPTVLQLRTFRDNILETSEFGRKFINFYYKNSPPIASYISRKTILKKVIYVLIIKPLSEISKCFTYKK